ncbi:hypothetical protein QAD02_007479 [Eretmocerus hayati]|uniref:Uncharacterized protein n=1 Tax=Eretmocerus hayati TaxID=131215 RepID=A0ACC2N681_9HYME|nr:hypothetical protein QAD02_007479 [Eretmocerus hayati]
MGNEVKEEWIGMESDDDSGKDTPSRKSDASTKTQKEVTNNDLCKMMRSKFEKMETKTDTITEKLDSGSINEVKDRMVREKNVIMHNVPEGSTNNFLAQFMSSLSSNGPFDFNMLKFERLGKVDPNKPRPVEIIFTSPDHAKLTLVDQKEFCF